MTANQLKYQQNQEAERANKQREREDRRRNRAAEDLKREDQRIQKVLGTAKVVTDAFGNLVQGGKAIGTLANDPAWYNLNRDLVNDVASISYESPLTSSLTTGSTDIATNVKAYRATLCGIDFIPSIGIGGYSGAASASGGSIANSAAQTLYAWVRHANSGSANYEPADLMMYYLAMDSAYTWYAFGRSIYRAANSALMYDFNFIQRLGQIYGVDLNDFRSNLANFRTFLNIIATQLNQLSVPNSMPYYNRHVWMVSNIFKDHPVKRSAYYCFVPGCYGVYKPAEGRIAFTARPSTAMKFSNFSKILNEIVSVLMTDESIGIINGDVRKAYGTDSLFKIENTPADDYVEPFYSEEVLSQISGIVAVGPVTPKTYDICQVPSTGRLYQGTYTTTGEPTVGQSYPTLTTFNNTALIRSSFILNMYKDNPTPDDNMVASRLIAGYNYFTSGSLPIRYVSVAGSEFVTTLRLFVGAEDAGGSIVTIYDYCPFDLSGLNTALPQMDWFPMFVYVSNPTDATDARLWAGDLCNYAVVSAEVTANMHATAIISEFYIPSKGIR